MPAPTRSRPSRRPRRAARPRRRGVTSVLSMMFLILFGSLAAAMAIASQGNLRTASTHLHVMRALSAAETGMAVARQRMDEAVSRFVISKGRVSQDVGEGLWQGSLSAAGETEVLPLDSGELPGGVADALVKIHTPDTNLVVVAGVDAPAIASAPSGLARNGYADEHWVVTPAIALTEQAESPAEPENATGSAFQITYAPLDDGVTVRIIVTGYDFDHAPGGVPLSRTIMEDVRLTKRVNHAVVSPTRIMVGKNVIVSGDLGSTYEDVTAEMGHPVVLRSDFAHMDGALDGTLGWFNQSLSDHDADRDNRLRVAHAAESSGLAVDTDGDNVADLTFTDVTGDGYVDEMDLFIDRYDSNGDGKVALSDALRVGTPAEALSPEFVDESGDPIDDDLAALIDASNPDRNRNGVYGFEDLDGDGLWDPGDEDLLDYDDVKQTYPDQVLGYRDGVIDRKDVYGKVGGRLYFRVAEDAWSAAQGDISEQLRGPIRARNGKNPVVFEADDDELPEVTADSFVDSQTELAAAADGDPFEQQVADQLGTSATALATWVETGSDPDPQFYRLDPDTNGDGLPDNWATAHFEKMPFNSPNHTDWYYRPVYRNMVFKDVEIPRGTNALFVGCTFVGVTLVRVHTDNDHVNWINYGKMDLDAASGRPKPVIPRQSYTTVSGLPTDILPESALPPNQLFLIPADVSLGVLDKADFPINGRPANWDDLPDPLIIDGERVTDTREHSNNIRFHDCLFIGSITSDTPGTYAHPRNKLQFTGSTRFADEHPDPDLRTDPAYNPDEADLEAIATSSMMLPNYSVDIGSFNSPPEQNVALKGVVIAGVMDLRGNASVDGALVLTFKPVLGEPPLVDVAGQPIGSTAGFNTTLGYFGPDDGDAESLDPQELTLFEGQRITGWDLDGDGLPDLPHDQMPTQAQLDAGAEPVPFYGYGRIDLRFNPDVPLPDGLMLPVSAVLESSSYREGRP